ncbi:hypothetical protein BDN72DRAFT_780061, partial [Pluteus cervinus]
MELVLNVQLKQPTTCALATHALVDSGATGSFIDSRFVEKYKIVKIPLKHPIHITNSDQSSNSLGDITHYARIKL